MSWSNVYLLLLKSSVRNSFSLDEFHNFSRHQRYLKEQGVFIERYPWASPSIGVISLVKISLITSIYMRFSSGLIHISTSKRYIAVI